MSDRTKLIAATAFWLIAMAAQFSDYHNSTVAGIFALLGGVFLIWAMLHHAKERRSQGKPIMEPGHLILGGLVGGALCLTIAAGGYLWQWITPATATTGVAPPNQRSAAEDELRRGLRKLILSQMDRLLAKFRDVIEDATNGQNPQHKDIAVELFKQGPLRDFNDIMALISNGSIDRLNTWDLEGMIVRFFKSYRDSQLIVSRLSAANNISAKKLRSFDQWIAADEQCLVAIRDLKASPAATRINEIQDPWMASMQSW